MLNKITGHEVDRRLLLKGAAAGGLGIAGATMLAGCAPGAAGPLTFGARTVDESPTQQLQALVAAYTAKTGNEVAYNATESNAFQASKRCSSPSIIRAITVLNCAFRLVLFFNKSSSLSMLFSAFF